MRCLLLLCALIPGVILPGRTMLCLCEAIACVDCQGCCPQAAPGPAKKDCCSAHRSACCKKRLETRLALSAKKACQGCVVLTTHKPTTPRPEVQGSDPLPLAAVPFELVRSPLDATSFSTEPLRRPTSHAPPGDTRSTPLLI